MEPSSSETLETNASDVTAPALPYAPNIGRITTGISATQRGHIAVVRQLLHQLEEAFGKGIPLDDLLKEAASRGIPEADVEDALTKLKQKGDIFEPRRGYISRIQ